jgi:uncharacterized membrane protein YhaH (DUF805 family)
MGFAEAISSGFANITNFEGRSSRPAFWWWLLFIWVLELVISLITGAGRGGTGFLYWIGFAIAIVLWIATLAVGCRRLHDTGKSGWLQLLLIIPCIGAIILIVFWVQPSTPGDNAYGPVPAA